MAKPFVKTFEATEDFLEAIKIKKKEKEILPLT